MTESSSSSSSSRTTRGRFLEAGSTAAAAVFGATVLEAVGCGARVTGVESAGAVEPAATDAAVSDSPALLETQVTECRRGGGEGRRGGEGREREERGREGRRREGRGREETEREGMGGEGTRRTGRGGRGWNWTERDERTEGVGGLERKDKSAFRPLALGELSRLVPAFRLMVAIQGCRVFFY